MVHKVQQSNYIYQLHPEDHTKVILYWRNIGDFIDYTNRIEFNYDLYYCYADDYVKTHGGPKDGKIMAMTRDQRFCMSRNYVGEVFKYNARGEYVGATDMTEFRKMGGWQNFIGCYGAPHGWDEFRGLNIMMRDMTAGYYWDYVKYDCIDPIYVPQTSIVQLGEELYSKLLEGAYTRQNPNSRFKQSVKARMEKRKAEKLQETTD